MHKNSIEYKKWPRVLVGDKEVELKKLLSEGLDRHEISGQLDIRIEYIRAYLV